MGANNIYYDYNRNNGCVVDYCRISPSIRHELKKSVPMGREEERRLFDEYSKSIDESRKKEIFDRIVLANLKFAFKMAVDKAKTCDKSVDDLFSEAKLGLIEAFHKYDPHVGVKFISFVVWYVRRALNTFVSDDDLIRIPIALKSRVYKKRRCDNPEFTAREDHAKDVIDNVKAAFRDADDPVNGCSAPEDVDGCPEGVAEFEKADMKSALWKMLEASLDKTELYIMRYSFGLKDDIVLPSANIAENLKLKKGEFQKIKKTAYEKILQNREFYGLLKETVNS